MYVRWKVLIGLGTTFWLLLCLFDYLPVRQIDTMLQKERVLQIETPTLKQHKKVEEGGSFIKVLFWNVVAFASTITACFILKTISSKLNIINNQFIDQNDRLTYRRVSSSRIPIPITNKSSSTDIHIEDEKTNTEEIKETDYNKSCPNLLGFQYLEEKPKLESKIFQNDKKNWSIKIMEKHCAKLREEMINLQMNSLKEQAAITKKMEALSREKRELIKQFNVTIKENKSLKQQLEEMIDERTLLIKRLECATKEMKNATKNKKNTIAKLDEAVANAETLKTNLERIKRDKVALEDKLIILDADYKRLTEEVELYRQKEKELERKLSEENKNEEHSKEHVIDKCDYDYKEKDDAQPHIEESDYDIRQSEEDIKKVQQKLLTLERSLENFKFRRSSKDPNKPNETTESEWSKSDEAETPTLCLYSDNDKIPVEEQPSSNSICTELSCPLEHRECSKAECFLKRKSEVTIFSSGEEIKQSINLQNYMAAKKKLPKLKTSISDDRLSVISELAVTTGDESADDWGETKYRMVSDSPAFQKLFGETQKKYGSI